MKNLIYLFFLVGLLSACETKPVETAAPVQKMEETLVETKDGVYTEWYEGKKQIKFRGGQDENMKRHGKWSYYSEDGVELSVTYYDHGLRNGFTIVKHPNGAIHYRGEYKNDTVVGVWSTFDPTGKLIEEKDYTIK